MRLRNLITIALVSILSFSNIAVATADSAGSGASMTHLKTGAGLATTLEAAGVILYVRGGATSSIIGDSVGSPNGQYVFHIPITANKSGVQHLGSEIVFFNTTNNLQLQLRNPVIDLKTGVVTAILPQVENKSMSVLTITNAATLKPKVTSDRKTKVRKTAYTGATLSFAPGIAAAISSILGLPTNSLPEATAFGSTDVTLYSKISKK
jgi:hypothetical protein